MENNIDYKVASYCLGDDEIKKCPCCGADPDLYNKTFETTRGVIHHKVVLCSTRNSALYSVGAGPYDEDLSCPLYSMSEEIEQALTAPTQREAVTAWNNYVERLVYFRSLIPPTN